MLSSVIWNELITVGRLLIFAHHITNYRFDGKNHYPIANNFIIIVAVRDVVSIAINFNGEFINLAIIDVAVIRMGNLIIDYKLIP